jgi:hypothetical protein
MIWHTESAVQYTFTHNSTHLHTNSTQNNKIYLLIAIGLNPVAAVQYTFTHKQYTEQNNIFVNSIGLTLGGSSTVHIYTQTVHRTTKYIC